MTSELDETAHVTFTFSFRFSEAMLCSEKIKFNERLPSSVCTSAKKVKMYTKFYPFFCLGMKLGLSHEGKSKMGVFEN
jgi:hypothetical protein